jgi:hypothetical protein
MTYSGAGGNAAPTEEGMGFPASLGSNITNSLRAPVGVIPGTGSPYARLQCQANATAGVAKFSFQDGKATPSTAPTIANDPSAVTLTTETTVTLTWASGYADAYYIVDIPLTTIPAAGDVLVAALTAVASGWTLAANVCVTAWLIWK